MVLGQIQTKRCSVCGKEFKALTMAQLSQNFAVHRIKCDQIAREKRIQFKAKMQAKRIKAKK